MYTLGVVLTVVGGIGIIGTIIWIVLDNNKKNKQRDKILENLRQQQYKQHNQNINRQEPTNQQTNKNTNQPCQDTKYSTMQRKRKSSM